MEGSAAFDYASCFEILKPKTETDTLGGKREALLKPRIIKEFLTKYSDSAIPHEDIALNVLKTSTCRRIGRKRWWR
jgi:hypothetical protein